MGFFTILVSFEKGGMSVMARLMVRGLIALLTFALGCVFAQLRVSYRSTAPRKVSVVAMKQAVAAQPRSEFIMFEETGNYDLGLWEYKSPDGKIAQYGCFERKSSFQLVSEMPRGMSRGRVVERTPVLTDASAKIGDRVVYVYDSIGEGGGAHIEWTEGSLTCDIYAPSLWHAVSLESSIIWQDQNRWTRRMGRRR